MWQMWQVAAVAGGALSERDRRIVRLKIMHISCKFKSAISREGDRVRERERERRRRRRADKRQNELSERLAGICATYAAGCCWLVSSCPILWLAPHEARGEARGGGRSLGQHPSGHIYSCNIKIVAAFASATCYLSAVRHFTAKGQRDDDDGDDEGRTQSKI